MDGIYNFFIKKISSLHGFLYEILTRICFETNSESDWFYKGATHVIPKGTPASGGDFRPITCMSNLYKVVTKCVTHVLQLEVEKRSLLAENQMETVRRVQGAKEQAFLNAAINKFNGHSLKVSYFDVRKAFDSVDHRYLLQCVRSLNLPTWIAKFVETLVSNWSLVIMDKGKVVLKKKMEREILQVTGCLL